MNRRDEQRNVKAIRLLQQRSDAIEEAHAAIGEDIRAIKDRLTELADADELTPKFAKGKLAHLEAMSAPRSLPAVDVETIFDESEAEFPGDAGLNDVLTPDDWAILDQRVAAHIQDFNARYDLDRWDYSIAGGCGLVAAMLDLNYTAWLALVWNGFHAVRWALLDRSLRLWDEVESREVETLQRVVERIDALVHRAERLPA